MVEIFKHLISLSTLIFLSACTPTNYIPTPVTDFLDPPIILSCPEHRVVSDASRIEKFVDGDTQGLIDVDFKATITNMRLACESNVDKQSKLGSMDVSISLDFLAERGPANSLGNSKFLYFLAITDRNYKILYRESFKVSFTFETKSSRLIMSSKPITVELPIQKETTNEDYIIFSGFQTSREQLNRNRLEKMQREN